MSIGVIDSKSFDEELEKLTGITKPVTNIVSIERGRPAGKLEIPESIRKQIASEAIISDLTGKEIAQKYDVSQSSVSAYKVGSTSTTTYNQPNNDLVNHVDSVKSDISSNARSRLVMALEQITSEKVAGAKIKDIAGIAKDMSTVVKNMESPIFNQQNNTQVIVYQPRQREESDYEIITVNE